MIALAEAFEDEQRKLDANKKHLHQNQLKFLEGKRELKAKRKTLNDVAKSLLKLEKSLVIKLHSIESVAQVNNLRIILSFLLSSKNRNSNNNMNPYNGSF